MENEVYAYVHSIADETIVCPKCGAKFKVQERVWVEEIQSNEIIKE